MKITVSNKIEVDGFNPDLLAYCKSTLVVDNPDYHKKERMGLWVGNTPKKIVLFEKIGTTLRLPFGCLDDIWRRYGSKGVPFERDICPIRRTNYQSRINLYPYQEKAVNEALGARNGVIVMPCGAGKTQTGLEIVSRIGGRTLWLTHTQDLLNQSMARAKSVLDVPVNTYGTITGGKINIGTGITFATVQTMAKLDLSELKYAFDVIIVDECHKAVGSPTKVMQFYAVLSSLSCRFKYGLTATPKRSDGLEKTMFSLIGNICTKVDKKAVADTTCPVVYEMIKTGYFPDMGIALAGDGTLNYANLVDDLTHNKERMGLVGNIVAEKAKDGATIVLGNRVEYLQTMDEYTSDIKSICLSGMGQSKKAKEMRKDALRRLNNGELDCVFATYQLAKEGLDVPNLRYVIFATPEKDETTVVQAAGRVGRKADGKDHGTIIDFEDDLGMLHGWAKKRRGYYKKLEYGEVTH